MGWSKRMPRACQVGWSQSDETEARFEPNWHFPVNPVAGVEDGNLPCSTPYWTAASATCLSVIEAPNLNWLFCSGVGCVFVQERNHQTVTLTAMMPDQTSILLLCPFIVRCIYHLFLAGRKGPRRSMTTVCSDGRVRSILSEKRTSNNRPVKE